MSAKSETAGSGSVDAEYVRIQHEESSTSHESPWGAHALDNLATYIGSLQHADLLNEDDIFCDFGGNDGTVAEAWRQTVGGTAICVDMDGAKQAWGEQNYPLVTFVNSGLESIPLDDKSIDWAFCSHTLEHVRDMSAAWSEILRITRRGICVVIPLESEALTVKNPAHMRAAENPYVWLRRLKADGWNLFLWGKSHGYEMTAFWLADDSRPKRHWVGEAWMETDETKQWNTL